MVLDDSLSGSFWTSSPANGLNTPPGTHSTSETLISKNIQCLAWTEGYVQQADMLTMASCTTAPFHVESGGLMERLAATHPQSCLQQPALSKCSSHDSLTIVQYCAQVRTECKGGGLQAISSSQFSVPAFGSTKARNGLCEWGWFCEPA